MTEKEKFEQALVNTIRAGMVEYDKFMASKMAEISTIEAARMGNFKDPETGNQYGFKLIIGKTDFFEDSEDESDDEEDYLDDE